MFPPITAIGFEIHNSDSDISFNNILISNDEKEVMFKKGMGVCYTHDNNNKRFIDFDYEYKENIINNI